MIQSLTRMKFSAGDFTDENICSICYVEYKADDDVTPLTCDTKHYYHTKCIEQWIQRGNNSCPLCRKPIKEDQS